LKREEKIFSKTVIPSEPPTPSCYENIGFFRLDGIGNSPSIADDGCRTKLGLGRRKCSQQSHHTDPQPNFPSASKGSGFERSCPCTSKPPRYHFDPPLPEHKSQNSISDTLSVAIGQFDYAAIAISVSAFEGWLVVTRQRT
jgi:hypothetical protein